MAVTTSVIRDELMGRVNDFLNIIAETFSPNDKDIIKYLNSIAGAYGILTDSCEDFLHNITFRTIEARPIDTTIDYCFSEPQSNFFDAVSLVFQNDTELSHIIRAALLGLLSSKIDECNKIISLNFKGDASEVEAGLADYFYSILSSDINLHLKASLKTGKKNYKIFRNDNFILLLLSKVFRRSFMIKRLTNKRTNFYRNDYFTRISYDLGTNLNKPIYLMDNGDIYSFIQTSDTPRFPFKFYHEWLFWSDHAKDYFCRRAKCDNNESLRPGVQTLINKYLNKTGKENQGRPKKRRLTAPVHKVRQESTTRDSDVLVTASLASSSKSVTNIKQLSTRKRKHVTKGKVLESELPVDSESEPEINTGRIFGIVLGEELSHDHFSSLYNFTMLNSNMVDLLLKCIIDRR